MINTQYATEAELAVMALARKRRELALMTDIPDMGQYVEDWITLGKQFQVLGYKYNAAICESNAIRYAGVKVARESRKPEVVVAIDDEQKIGFETVDEMAEWLAEVIQGGTNENNTVYERGSQVTGERQESVQRRAEEL